jgi:FkbM family methyltransferase
MDITTWSLTHNEGRAYSVSQTESHSALLKQGIFHLREKKYRIALEYFTRYISFNSDSPRGHYFLGIIYNYLNNPEQAEIHFNKSLLANPNDAEVYLGLGLNQLEQGKTENAIKCFEKSLRLNPHHAEAYIALGNVYLQKNSLPEALRNYENALTLQTDHAEALKGVAIVLNRQGRFQESFDMYERILSLNTDKAEIYLCMGNALKAKGDFEAAIGYYHKALSLEPDNPKAHLFIGLIHLLQGKFDPGWNEYEWRWKADPLVKQKDRYTMPLWDGRSLGGKTLLLHSEQGYGDSIHFIRYIRMLKGKGGRVLLEAPESLRRLFEGIPDIHHIITKGDTLPSADFHASLLHLPRIFQTDLHTIPAEIPYLSINQEDIEKWKDRLNNYPGLKVGIVWAGSPHHKKDHLRSLSLPMIQAFLEVPNVTFFSFQVGERADDLKQYDFCKNVQDISPELSDFAETGAVLHSVDLLISVDTSVAHLAGALGRPVWTLLPFIPDWRWLMEREDSPWYPSMRLFRQNNRAEWEPVINRVATELRRLAFGDSSVVPSGSHLYEKEITMENSLRTLCKCCASPVTLLGTVDYSKTCMDHINGKVFPDSDQRVPYYRCRKCGFLFTDLIDDWDQHQIKDRIFNEEYIRADPDFIKRRPEANARLINCLFGKNKEQLFVLDYGGGEGSLAYLLRNAGFKNVDVYDPMYHPDFKIVGKKYHLMLAFEVMEHLSDPHSVFRDVNRFLQDEGVFFFSTLVQPDDIGKIGTDWWYAAPRNGHVSLHSFQSLEILASEFGFQLQSLNRNQHMVYRHLPDFANHLRFGLKGWDESRIQNPEDRYLNRNRKITGIRQCRHGIMLYVKSDMYVGRSLELYGEFSEGETDIFHQLLRTGDIIVEAGANIGAHTVYLANTVGPSGCVIAYEPQRFLHQILCANLAMNELMNVYARQAALGEQIGKISVPVPDYGQTGNFGGISLGRGQGEAVTVETIDSLHLPRLRMIKADVEGMEYQVLKGGMNSIRKHRPLLYVENDRKEKSSELIRLIQKLGYRMWWHLPPLFNPSNYKGNKENVFGNIVSVNLLCIHKESPANIQGLREVKGPDDHWQKKNK